MQSETILSSTNGESHGKPSEQPLLSCARGKSHGKPIASAIQRILQATAHLPACPSPRVICIDGRSAAGKTTLAAALAKALDADVIHMDDFFLPAELRTSERLSEPGGNVHYERFETEVLPFLKKDAPFAYKRFACHAMALTEKRTVSSRDWRIVEGAYAMHPRFGEYADLKVFVDISPEEQMQRIISRNGATQAEAFRTRWIPLEEKYFSAFGLPNSAAPFLLIN